MIIPDCNNGTINVHLKLDSEKNFLKEQIASMAFSHLTGLSYNEIEKSTSFKDLEYYIFKTDTFPRIYITCGESDIHDSCSVISSITEDKNTNDVIVTFIGVIIYKFHSEDIIPMIDFLYQYKDELMTTKSGIFI